MFFNPDTLNNKKAKRFCKILFIAGFVFMPALWITLIWFLFKYVKPSTSYRNKYIIAASVMLLIELFALLIWNITYKYMWDSWGVVGDVLSVVNHKGPVY
ncbi:Two tm domain gamma-secretase aspartyl protease com [Entamoeba marina]